MKNVCFYHKADMDGIMSAYIVAKYYKNLGEEVTFVGMNYGDTYDRTLIAGNRIIVVDYSLDDMDDVEEYAGEFIWIDHHISAAKKYEYLWDKVDGLRNTEVAACELTWMYYYVDDVPKIVLRLADYDIWKFKYDDTEYISQAVKADYEPGIRSGDDLYKLNNIFSDETYEKLLVRGKKIVAHQDYLVEEVYNKGRTMMFEGYVTRVMTTGIHVSKTGNYACKQKNIDIGLMLFFVGDKWVASLRSIKEDVDVSKIATKYGGGGHKHASGFNIFSMDEFTKKLEN